MVDLEQAKEILKSGNYTAVLCKGQEIYTSDLRGVKPLVIWVESGKNFGGFSAADKVVGKATAFLYLKLAVRQIYAQIISKPALNLLKDSGISITYGTLVENIINRQGNGICPFEQQVLHISDVNDAYIAIREKMHQMNIQI